MHNNVACFSHHNRTDVFVDINSVVTAQPWCLNSLLTPFYFICFVLAGQFVLMNVVIAVLMKQLEVNILNYFKF